MPALSGFPPIFSQLYTINPSDAGNGFAYGSPVDQQLNGYKQFKDIPNSIFNVEESYACLDGSNTVNLIQIGSPQCSAGALVIGGSSTTQGQITFSSAYTSESDTTVTTESSSTFGIGISTTLSFEASEGVEGVASAKEGVSATLSFDASFTNTQSYSKTDVDSTTTNIQLGPFCQPAGSSCTARVTTTKCTSSSAIDLPVQMRGYTYYALGPCLPQAKDQSGQPTDNPLSCYGQNNRIQNAIQNDPAMTSGARQCFKFYYLADPSQQYTGQTYAQADVDCLAAQGYISADEIASTTRLLVSGVNTGLITDSYNVTCVGGDKSSCPGTVSVSGGDSSSTTYGPGSNNGVTGTGSGSTTGTGSGSGTSAGTGSTSNGNSSGSGGSSGNTGTTTSGSNTVTRPLICPAQLGVVKGSCNATLPDFSSLVSRSNSDTQGSIYQIEAPGSSVSLGTNVVHFTANQAAISCQSLYQVVPPWSSYFLPMETTLTAPYDGSDIVSSYTFGYEGQCDNQYGVCQLASVTSQNNPGFTWKYLSDPKKSTVKLSFASSGKWVEDSLTFVLSCADGYGNQGSSQIVQNLELQSVVVSTVPAVTTTVTQHSLDVAQFTQIVTYYTNVIVPEITVDLVTKTYYSSTVYTNTVYVTVQGASEIYSTTTTTAALPTGTLSKRALPAATMVTTTGTSTYYDQGTFTRTVPGTTTSVDLENFTASVTKTVTNTMETATYFGVLSTDTTVILKTFLGIVTQTVTPVNALEAVSATTSNTMASAQTGIVIAIPSITLPSSSSSLPSLSMMTSPTGLTGISKSLSISPSTDEVSSGSTSAPTSNPTSYKGGMFLNTTTQVTHNAAITTSTSLVQGAGQNDAARTSTKQSSGSNAPGGSPTGAASSSAISTGSTSTSNNPAAVNGVSTVCSSIGGYVCVQPLGKSTGAGDATISSAFIQSCTQQCTLSNTCKAVVVSKDICTQLSSALDCSSGISTGCMLLSMDGALGLNKAQLQSNGIGQSNAATSVGTLPVGGASSVNSGGSSIAGAANSSPGQGSSGIAGSNSGSSGANGQMVSSGPGTLAGTAGSSSAPIAGSSADTGAGAVSGVSQNPIAGARGSSGSPASSGPVVASGAQGTTQGSSPSTVQNSIQGSSGSATSSASQGSGPIAGSSAPQTTINSADGTSTTSSGGGQPGDLTVTGAGAGVAAGAAGVTAGTTTGHGTSGQGYTFNVVINNNKA